MKIFLVKETGNGGDKRRFRRASRMEVLIAAETKAEARRIARDDGWLEGVLSVAEIDLHSGVLMSSVVTRHIPARGVSDIAV